MNVKNNNPQILLMALMILFINYAVAKDESTREKAPIVIQGEVIKAITVAQHDFTNFIMVKNPKTADLQLFLSDLKNYEVVVEEHEETIKISFFPKKYNGRSIKGGGGEYQIEKTNFGIVKKKYYE